MCSGAHTRRDSGTHYWSSHLDRRGHVRDDNDDDNDWRRLLSANIQSLFLPHDLLTTHIQNTDKHIHILPLHHRSLRF